VVADLVGALPAVQSGSGSTSQAVLSFELPAIAGIEAWDVRIAYSAEVFEALLPGAFGSAYSFVFDAATVGSPKPPARDDFRGLTADDIALLESRNAQDALRYEQVNVGMVDLGSGVPVFLLDHTGGALFHVQFRLKPDAVLGPTTVFTHFIYGTGVGEEIELAQPLRTSATIAAIPEPGAWAMMLAGLALLGASAVRARGRGRP